MNKLLFLLLAMGCVSSRAETPAANPMPDGSRDMYAGLGVQSAQDGPPHPGRGAVPTAWRANLAAQDRGLELRE